MTLDLDQYFKSAIAIVEDEIALKNITDSIQHIEIFNGFTRKIISGKIEY